MSKYYLSIAIPTYNRHDKLGRLISILINQINENELSQLVQIVICDNSSNKLTQQICDKYKGLDNFTYNLNNENIGFDRNVLLSYELSTSNYVWFVADDDLPKVGSIMKIIKTLKQKRPEILLFSFGQPPTSKTGTFALEEKIYQTDDLIQAIDFINHFPKISTYVLKKNNNLNNDELTTPFIDLGWMHLILSYSLLHSSTDPSVVVMSEILATCDDEFDKLDWGPIIILNSYKISAHPFIINVEPGRYKKEKIKSYLDSIQFAFAAKIGTLRVTKMEEYDLFIKSLPFKLMYLLNSRKSFVQLVLLKTKLTSIYAGMKKTAVYRGLRN